LNCAALSEQLLESELFGHERGAFTSAHARKAGLVETAEGGTVFLDELGELPPSGQVKLLQLLENKTYRRVGGTEELHANVRIVAATNAGLEQRVAAGMFRSDLFFRLNVVAIHIPPLREHGEDIQILASHFLGRFNAEMGCSVDGISSEAFEMLTTYDWPGNVRELRNVIERALILNQGATELRPEHLPPRVRDATRKPSGVDPSNGILDTRLTLEEAERRLIREALERSGGNQSKAARELGVSRDTLRYRMKKHGTLKGES
jgi:transcriptional regulator with PAS, ATPase and Fis domain